MPLGAYSSRLAPMPFMRGGGSFDPYLLTARLFRRYDGKLATQDAGNVTTAYDYHDAFPWLKSLTHATDDATPVTRSSFDAPTYDWQDRLLGYSATVDHNAITTGIEQFTGNYGWTYDPATDRLSSESFASHDYDLSATHTDSHSYTFNQRGNIHNFPQYNHDKAVTYGKCDQAAASPA